MALSNAATYWLSVVIRELNGRRSTEHGYGQAVLQDLYDCLKGSTMPGEAPAATDTLVQAWAESLITPFGHYGNWRKGMAALIARVKQDAITIRNLQALDEGHMKEFFALRDSVKDWETKFKALEASYVRTVERGEREQKDPPGCGQQADPVAGSVEDEFSILWDAIQCLAAGLQKAASGHPEPSGFYEGRLVLDAWGEWRNRRVLFLERLDATKPVVEPEPASTLQEPAVPVSVLRDIVATLRFSSATHAIHAHEALEKAIAAAEKGGK